MLGSPLIGRVAGACAVGLLGCAAAPPVATPPSPAPGPVAAQSVTPPSSARVIAVGDLHADLPQALALLGGLGLVDPAGHWVGGDTVLVQTGDLTDRGPDSLEVIQLMDRLVAEAPAAGGRVVSLLGNHEVMNLQGDLRYVTPGDVADFGSDAARAAAFGPQGALGRSLRSRDAVARVGRSVFVHGGVSAAAASLGIDGLNAAVRAEIDGAPGPALGPEGPLWYRAYLLADESVACEEAARALSLLDADRMVMGHTTQPSGRPVARCGGRLIGIDVGIAGHYGGHLAALELRGDDAWAWTPTGATDLPDPSPPPHRPSPPPDGAAR